MAYVWLGGDLYPKEEAVLQRVDDDKDIAKLGGDDSSAILTTVLGPHNVDLVISQVSNLQWEREIFLWVTAGPLP